MRKSEYSGEERIVTVVHKSFGSRINSSPLNRPDAKLNTLVHRANKVSNSNTSLENCIYTEHQCWVFYLYILIHCRRRIENSIHGCQRGVYNDSRGSHENVVAVETWWSLARNTQAALSAIKSSCYLPIYFVIRVSPQHGRVELDTQEEILLFKSKVPRFEKHALLTALW